MSARSNMTMRTAVERKTDGATTGWNRPGAPTFGEVAGDVPCKVFSVSRQDKDDAGKAIVVEDLRANISTASVDAGLVQEGDQLVNVRDRLGFVQFTGPLLVERMFRAGGAVSRPSHYVLHLRRHGGT